MKFNPNPSKQAQEIIFSRKVSKPFCPDVHFDYNPVNSTSLRKHVEIILDWSNFQALFSKKLFIKHL